MKGIYRMNFSYGRMGDLEGLFIADSDEVKNAIGREVYFGEVLGKHSDVGGPLEKSDIDLITTDESAIKILLDLFGETISGYNPLHYLYDED